MSCYSFNDAGETKGSTSSRKEAAAQRLEAYRVAPRLCSRCSLYLQLLLSLQAPLLLDKWISVKHQQELLKSNLTLHQVHTAQANVVFTTTRQQLQKLLKRSRRFFSPMTSHLAGKAVSLSIYDQSLLDPGWSDATVATSYRHRGALFSMLVTDLFMFAGSYCTLCGNNTTRCRIRQIKRF